MIFRVYMDSQLSNFHFIRALFIYGGFKAEVESSFLRAVEGTVLPEKVYLIAFLAL